MLGRPVGLGKVLLVGEIWHAAWSVLAPSWHADVAAHASLCKCLHFIINVCSRFSLQIRDLALFLQQVTTYVVNSCLLREVRGAAVDL